MSLSLSEIELEIDGEDVKFDAYSNDEEYEIDSTDLPDIAISDCIRALRRFSRTRTAKQRPHIALIIRLPTSDKAFWEGTTLGIYIADKYSHYDLEFMVNASIGMQQDEVWNVVASRVAGSEFSMWGALHDNDEWPLRISDGWRGWSIVLRLKPKSRSTFKELFQLRSRISQEIFLPPEKLAAPYPILRVIRSGQVEALLGRSESEFLEVKSSAYDLKNLDEARWKLELAQDVAQFANAPSGGLLLIGYRTKNANGIDVIQKITPVQPKDARLQAYSDVLKNRIHPPVGGLQVGSIPVGKNEIIYFYIPAQPEENKPYIISGAVIDGCYDSAGISIVRRQGDSSIPVTAQEIHAALVIGRALIRGHRNSK